MKKPLCTFPWAHLDIETNGDIKYCCASVYDEGLSHTDDDGNHYNINTHSIDDAWNSDRMRQLREKLYNGIKAKECKVCWMQEEKGLWSVRNAANDAEKDCYPDIQETVNRSAENDFYVEEKPKYYQIQTGNLCNLACKMCHSDYSTTYGDFFYELYPEDVNQNKYNNVNKVRHQLRNTKPLRHEWPVRIGLKNLINNEKLQYITRLYLSGGEPTIILENLKFLDYLVESGHSKHIHLIITTNATKINPNFAESIKHFQTVTMLLSIDSVGDAVELQRYPAKWDRLDANIQQYMKLAAEYPSINVSFNIVISSLTLPYLDQLLIYIANINKTYMTHNTELNSSAIVGLDSGDFNLTHVPQSVAQKCLRAIKQVYNDNQNYFTSRTQSDIENFIEFLNSFLFNNDYTEIHTALETLQEHHPDYDIKDIFQVYYL